MQGTIGDGVESAKAVAATETQGIEEAVVSDGDKAHFWAACGAASCAAILLYRMSSSSALDRLSAVDTLLADALVVTLGSMPTGGVSTMPAVVGCIGSAVAAFLRRMWSISISSCETLSAGVVSMLCCTCCRDDTFCWPATIVESIDMVSSSSSSSSCADKLGSMHCRTLRELGPRACASNLSRMVRSR